LFDSKKHDKQVNFANFFITFSIFPQKSYKSCYKSLKNI
jgi:hypothetical protein